MPCRPSKRTGVDVLAKAACHSLTLCQMAVMQAEQETSCGDRLAGSIDLTRLVYRPTALNGR